MKFKLFRVVSPLSGGKKGTLAFPPISLGILYRYLRECHFDIEQDDLHCRWHHEMPVQDNRKLLSISNDEQRMWKYLKGNRDEGWEWFGQKVLELSDFETPDVFLFSIISSDIQCCRATLAFAGFLKRRFNKPIIIGGEYFAYAPIYYMIEPVLSLGIADYYILGYAEKSLEQLLSVISGKASRGLLREVQGLVYFENNQTCKNSFLLKHAVVPPAFDGLPIELYRWSAEIEPPGQTFQAPVLELTLPFHTSTGCPHNCSFCDCSGMEKGTILEPQVIVDELQNLVNRYNCHTFFFLDNTINISKRYINDLCDRIIEARLDIRWMACGSVHGMDEATLVKMHKAGVTRIVWGLESGSSRVLNYVKKPFKLEHASKVFKIAHEVGIWNGVDIIVGIPTETEAEFRDTLDFLESHVDVLDEVWPYQFYLNSASDMCKNPSAYRLTNLRPVNRKLAKDAVNGSVCASYVFDELDGYRWEEKEIQIKKRMVVLLENLVKWRLYPMGLEHEQQANLLSWCYRQSANKADIRRLYHTYWERLAINRTWWSEKGRAISVAEVAEELFKEMDSTDLSDLKFDEYWKYIYPEEYMPFYPELSPELSYKNSLLIDGMYHDMLVYSKLKGKLLNP